MEDTLGVFRREAVWIVYFTIRTAGLGNFSQESLFKGRFTKHQNLSLAASAADRETITIGRPGAGTVSPFVFNRHSPCFLGYHGAV